MIACNDFIGEKRKGYLDRIPPERQPEGWTSFFANRLKKKTSFYCLFPFLSFLVAVLSSKTHRICVFMTLTWLNFCRQWSIGYPYLSNSISLLPLHSKTTSYLILTKCILEGKKDFFREWTFFLLDLDVHSAESDSVSCFLRFFPLLSCLMFPSIS